MTEALRKCSKCNESKPVDDFRLLKSGHRTSHCKPCAREYLREWRLKNDETLRERRRVQYEAMTEEQREAKRAYGRKTYERGAESQRSQRMIRQFGITPAQYDELLASQGGACAICGQSCRTGRRLAIDHCHKSGAVRGLLCARCNNGLGNFQDDPERLIRASEYLGVNLKE